MPQSVRNLWILWLFCNQSPLSARKLHQTLVLTGQTAFESEKTMQASLQQNEILIPCNASFNHMSWYTVRVICEYVVIFHQPSTLCRKVIPCHSPEIASTLQSSLRIDAWESSADPTLKQERFRQASDRTKCHAVCEIYKVYTHDI